MESNNKTVTLKDVKAFLPRINCKIVTSKLREAFQEVDTTKQNEIGFDDFTTLHNRLIFDENVSAAVNIIEVSGVHLFNYHCSVNNLQNFAFA